MAVTRARPLLWLQGGRTHLSGVSAPQPLLVLPAAVLAEPGAHPDILVPLQKPVGVECPGQA